jgi:RNA polymerase sigma factor (sigma-70 family)
MSAASTTLGGFLSRLKLSMAAESLSALSDHDLVDRFLASQDEAAFQAILHRHGLMVFRVCRRALSREQDAEDAFQATFLVLARQARSIREQSSLASWLHGVAYRVALKTRSASARRREREMPTEEPDQRPALTDEVSWKELRSLLDEELARLPEKYRAPLVLCYLEGLTQDEAAQALGWAKITCRRNLERARELLGSRLARRGVTLSAVLFAPLLSECLAGPAVPPALLTSTAEAGAALAVGQATKGAVSAQAVVLANGLVRSALAARLKSVGVLLLVVLAAGVGVASVARRADPGEPPPPVVQAETAIPAGEPPTPALRKIDQPRVAEKFDVKGARLFAGDVLLLVRGEVQEELQLSPEQVRRIFRAAPPRAPSQRTPGSPARSQLPNPEEIQASNAALRSALPDILTPAQAHRLRQLQRQVASMWAFQDPENQRLLELTDHQKVEVRTHLSEAVRQGFPPGGPADERISPLLRWKEAEKDAVERIVAMLTERQKKIWNDLIGEPFDFSPRWPPGVAIDAASGRQPSRP